MTETNWKYEILTAEEAESMLFPAPKTVYELERIKLEVKKLYKDETIYADMSR